jgi:hypothetical protein
MSQGTQVQVRLQHDVLGVLDDYRRKQPNPPSRGKALRDLARDALRRAMSSHDGSSGTSRPTE